MTHTDKQWRQEAACRGSAAGLFFPEPGASGQEVAAAAKQVCAGCAVRVDCLAEALATHENRGIWGGLTPVERRRLSATGPAAAA